MALIDLKSDLSWYGKTAPGFKPNADRSNTDFKVNDDSTISTVIQGYGITGAAKSFRQVVSSDKFIISNQGDSSRAAQLGSGTRFPIGPEGQIHKFDKTRTGFSDKVKYSDQYGVKFGTAGLADTYTINSPIDDMYNKFNLRDDATPNSYIKHPLILRGIQRNDNSDPQRWGINVGPGLSGAFDIPRGGIVTAANRALIDAVRHAKFLASPRGLGFLAKQVGYQLMNPYKETRLYNPLSLGSIAPIVHINRHLGGELATNILNLAGKPDRLANLRSELFTDFDKNNESGLNGKGAEIGSLSSKFGGPGSIFGIGGTSIKRYEDTSLKTQLEGTTYSSGLLGIASAALDGLKDFVDSRTGNTLGGSALHSYSYGTPYVSTYDTTGGSKSQADIDGSDTPASLKFRAKEAPSRFGPETDQTESTTIGLESNPRDIDFGTTVKETTPYDSETKYTTDPIEENPRSLEKNKTNWKEIGVDRGGDGTALPGGGFAERKYKNVRQDYIRMSYGDIPERQPGTTTLNDFRESVNSPHTNKSDSSQAGFAGWGSDRKIDEIDETLDDSLVKFSIGSIKFKAYIGSVNDSFAPSWNGEQDQGRADSRYLYGGFERTLSLDFIVPIYSKSQRRGIWSKLQDLARITYPVYGGQGFYGQSTTLRLGDMYNNLNVIITDLSYDWDNETPWEITAGEQAPFYTSVQLGFTVLDDKPSSSTRIYSNI